MVDVSLKRSRMKCVGAGYLGRKYTLEALGAKLTQQPVIDDTRKMHDRTHRRCGCIDRRMDRRG